LYCVDISGGNVCRRDASGTLSTWVHTGGGPNGSRFGPNGDLFIADNGKRAVLRMSTSSPEYSVYADRFEGTQFAGPNDLCFGPDGTLYFTDPVGSDLKRRVGCVYAVGPDRAVHRVAEGLAFPNGVAITDDGLTLIVGETHTGILHRFNVGAGADFEELTPLAVLAPARDGEQEAGPDGMAYGDDGNLYVAHFGAGVIDVVAPSGEVLRTLRSGGPTPTNLAFWERSLYV